MCRRKELAAYSVGGRGWMMGVVLCRRKELAAYSVGGRG